MTPASSPAPAADAPGRPPLRPALGGLLAMLLAGCGDPEPRNVILLIADGAGYNTWTATAMYEGTLGEDLLDGEEWTRLAVSTHPLRNSKSPEAPPLAQDAVLVYDPARAWDTRPATTTEGQPDEYPWYFEGYRWLRRFTDSANTATTLATGVKTYVGAINVDGSERPIRDTLPALAKRTGRRAGIVSSVPFSHATPAALGGARSTDRKAYVDIATQLLLSDELSVVIGAGHPHYDHDARAVPADSSDYDYVGGEALWNHLSGWGRLAPGDTIAADGGRPITAAEIAALDRWDLVEDPAIMRALADSATAGDLLVVARVGATLQSSRASAGDSRGFAPYEDPLLPGLPTLEQLTRAALATLGPAPDGFYLTVEGGAVDWAMHGNELGRMVEEMIDFKASIRAVIEWVERESSWEETLVVVTGDHDHMLWGPNAHEVPFDPLVDRGPGRLPDHRWLSDTHSLALIPVFARGPGAEALLERVRGEDPVRGPWIDQSDVYDCLAAPMRPEPAATTSAE